MTAPVPRRRRPAIVAVALIAVVALALIAGTASPPAPPPDPARTGPPHRTVATAAAQAPQPVAGSLVDAALLPPGGRDAAPRLLTVAHDSAVPSRAVLTVLERSGGRWSARAGAEHRPPTLARTAVPWLVAIDDRRFILVMVAPEAAVTWLAAVTWTGEELRVGPVASVGGIADAATAADAFGDGTSELVLVESRTRRGGGTCQGSHLTVLDGSTLRVEVQSEVPNLRLAAGVPGQLDDTAGADLVAAAYSNCPAGPAAPNRLRIVAVRLADGMLLADRRIEPADPLIAWSGRPAIVDVDRDGRHEVLIGSARSLIVVDPRGGWRLTEVGGAPGVLLGAIGSPDTNGATVATLASDALRMSRLQRSGTWTLATTLRVDGSSRAPGWDAAGVDVRATAMRSGASGWLLDDPDCPTLVVPLAVAPCNAASPATSGPAWVATRPIATLPAGRLLVAQTDAWPAPGLRLVAPSPMASERAGASWRQGPSERFSLFETADAADAPRTPDTTMDAFAAGVPPVVGVAAPPGTRLVTATHGGASSRLRGDSLAGLLADPPRDGGRLDFERVPESGRLELDLPRRPDGTAPEWTVELVGIGPLGDVTPVVGATVELDVAPPAVAIDDAFMRAPWPLRATIGGRTEPGATVSDGTRDVTASEDGRFAFEQRLAPWPRRVSVRATDPAGNVGTASADLMGGPDLRRLPWIPIVAVGVVLGAALNGLRGRGGVPRPGSHGAEDPATAEDGPAVEELQPRRLQ